MLVSAALFGLFLLIPTAVPTPAAMSPTAHSRRMHPDKKHEDDDPKPVILQELSHNRSPFLRWFFSTHIEKTQLPT
ncbi:MAG TPA: hypothetical protein VGL70_11790 [Candidatus Binatia bacterium]|jgi:hypothetical protein